MNQENNWKNHAVQSWEQQFLYYDCLLLFVSSDQKQQQILQQLTNSNNEFLANWDEMNLHNFHLFDLDRYNDFVTGLESRIFIETSVRRTRKKVALIRERSKNFKICSIKNNGNIRLNPSYFFNEKWKADIEGWTELEENSDDPIIKNWLRRFKERSMNYHEAHMQHMIGGPPVEYDFSSGRTGPFPAII